MNIVLTGKLKLNRSIEIKKFNDFGIKVQSQVSGKTNFLVTGYDVGNTKIQKARDLGVPIVTEKKFFEILKDLYPEYLL